MNNDTAYMNDRRLYAFAQGESAADFVDCPECDDVNPVGDTHCRECGAALHAVVEVR